MSIDESGVIDDNYEDLLDEEYDDDDEEDEDEEEESDAEKSERSDEEDVTNAIKDDFESFVLSSSEIAEMIDDQMSVSKDKREERTIDNIMTQYEKVAIVSYRAQQIAEGSQVFVDVGDLTDSIQIADKELNENKIPFAISRF